MAQTTVSIRMDNDLKNNFDHICNELGMSMSTAVTMLAKKMTIAEMEATGGTIHEVDLDD